MSELTLFALPPFTKPRGRKRLRLMVHLTPRERAVMQHVSKGESYKEIANKLKITSGVVRNHVNRVHKKLNLPSTTSVTAACVSLKLIEADVTRYYEEVEA